MEGRFGAIEMIPVFPKPEAAAIRLIVRAIKGRKTPTRMLPGITLNDSNGTPSAFAERILRGGASIFGD
jgi:tRNA1(Val) A37 N6-methylase TrmN6